MKKTKIIVLLCATLMAGCGQKSETENSAFGRYVEQLDDNRMRQSLHHAMDSDSSRWAAVGALKQYYAKSEKPVWYDRQGVSDDADQLLAYLRRELPQNGLDTAAFHMAEIATDLQTVRELAFDSLGVDINDVLPRLDYHLSRAFVVYSTYQRYGFVRPDKLLNGAFMRDDSTGYARLFDYQVEAPDYQHAVHQLTADDRMNYLQSSGPQNPLYITLREALSKTTSRQARQQLLVNMERCRWRTKQPDRTPRVLVNLPAQQLWAIHSDSVLDMRICFGAKATKTPVLCSEIKYMQVNPDWLIPFSIIKKDVVRHEHDSAYFARNHYYIVDRQTGDTLNPVQVSADQMRSGKLRIGQTGGAHNSLGRIIFRFPNQFDIYLHDTNNRGAFSRDRRALSHGCIRVQKPFELAQFLLSDATEWELDRLRISMDLAPVSEQGMNWLEEHADDAKPHRLVSYAKVSPSVPVYIVYYTVYPNPATGTLETFQDVYGYDALILREIKPWLAENPS